MRHMKRQFGLLNELYLVLQFGLILEKTKANVENMKCVFSS